MSTDVKQRSFWSTTSGVLTGVAGTVTGVVALLGVATQAGWVGGDGDGDKADTPASVQTQGSTTPSNNGAPAGGGSSGSATKAPQFTVDPTKLTFDTLNKKGTVKVVNSGDVAMTVSAPKVEGANPTQFSATAPTCTRAQLSPGRTCDVEVTFAPTKGGSYNATLVIQVTGARAQEVTLSGTAIL